MKEQKSNPAGPGNEWAYFSRPGSAYTVKAQGLYNQSRSQESCGNGRALRLTEKQSAALSNGDVLTHAPNDNGDESDQAPSFSPWRM